MARAAESPTPIPVLASPDSRLLALAHRWAAAGLIADVVTVAIPTTVPSGFTWPARYVSSTGEGTEEPLREYLAAHNGGEVRLVAIRGTGGGGTAGDTLEHLRTHIRTSLNIDTVSAIDLLEPMSTSGGTISTAAQVEGFQTSEAAGEWIRVVVSPEDRPSPGSADAGFDRDIVPEVLLHTGAALLGVLGGFWRSPPTMPKPGELGRARLARVISRLLVGGEEARTIASDFVSGVLPSASIAHVDQQRYLELPTEEAWAEAPAVADALQELTGEPFGYRRPTVARKPTPRVSAVTVLGWYLPFLWQALGGLTSTSSERPGAMLDSLLQRQDLGVLVGTEPRGASPQRPSDWREVDSTLRTIFQQNIAETARLDVPTVAPAVWKQLVEWSFALTDGQRMDVPRASDADPAALPLRRHSRTVLLPVESVFEDPEPMRTAPVPAVGADDPAAPTTAFSSEPAPEAPTHLGDEERADPSSGLSPSPLPVEGATPQSASQPTESAQRGLRPDLDRRKVVRTALAEEFGRAPACAADVTRSALDSVDPYTYPESGAGDEAVSGAQSVTTLRRQEAMEAGIRNRVEREVLQSVSVGPREAPPASAPSNHRSVWGRLHRDVYRARLRASLDAAWWSADALAPTPEPSDDLGSAMKKFRQRIGAIAATVALVTGIQLVFADQIQSWTSDTLGFGLTTPMVLYGLVLLAVVGVLAVGYPPFAATRAEAERIRRLLEARQHAGRLAVEALAERNRLRLAHRGVSLWSSLLGWTTLRGFRGAPLASLDEDPLTVDRPRAMQLAQPLVENRRGEIMDHLIAAMAKPGWRSAWAGSLIHACDIRDGGTDLPSLYADDAVADTALAQVVTALSGGRAQSAVCHEAGLHVVEELESHDFGLADLRVRIHDDLPRFPDTGDPLVDDWLAELATDAPFAPYLLADRAVVQSATGRSATLASSGPEGTPIGLAEGLAEAAVRCDLEAFESDAWTNEVRAEDPGSAAPGPVPPGRR